MSLQSLITHMNEAPIANVPLELGTPNWPGNALRYEP